jgi:hypothetical protein
VADLSVLESRCLSYGSLTPYLPLADLVRALCGLTEADSRNDSIQAIRNARAASGAPPEDDRWQLRLLGVVEPGHEVANCLSSLVVRR